MRRQHGECPSLTFCIEGRYRQRAGRGEDPAAAGAQEGVLGSRGTGNPVFGGRPLSGRRVRGAIGVEGPRRLPRVLHRPRETQSKATDAIPSGWTSAR